ncbi:MAG TPA: hypothetical protein VFY98_03350 [Intrasporangium sp.]|nr:hypothetical protein [Intrasporangium sp.]
MLSAATVVLGAEGWATAVVSGAVGDGVCEAGLVVSVGVGVGSVGVAVGTLGLEVGVGDRGLMVVVGGGDVGSAASDVVLVGRVGVGSVTVDDVTVGPVTVGPVTVGSVAVGDTLAVRDGLRVGRFTPPPPPHAVSRTAPPMVSAASLADNSSFIRRSLLAPAMNLRPAAA